MTLSMHEQKGKTRTMHHALFSTEIIEKHQHEKGVLVGIGRDLKLPQSIALSQCRLFSTKLYQMWSDGFTVDYTLECLTDWILEEAKTDDDLYWSLYKNSRTPKKIITQPL